MASSSEGKVLASLREGNQLRPGPTVCSLCDDDAFAKCITCGKNLCSDCRVSHKKQRASRDHDVVDIGLLTSALELAKCRSHGSLEVKYICHNCTDICCKRCLIEGHSSHKYSDIDESIDHVKDICQDLAKDLRTPFNTIQGNLGAIKTANEGRAKSYKHTKQELLDRKQKLINLINKIANDEVKSLDKTDYEAEQLYKRTESDIHECHKKCEKVLAPVMSIVMGHDVNKIITCIQRIQQERESVDNILGDANAVEQAGSVCLPGLGETFNTVSDIVKYFLTPQTSQGSGTRDASTTATVQPKRNTASNENVEHYTSASILSQKKATSLLVIHKTKLDNFNVISKRVHKEHFLMHHFGRVCLVKYDRELTRLTNTFPRTFDSQTITILTIDESRHIIANSKSLNLCNKSRVMCSVAYTDGYVPNFLAYFNADKFLSVCYKKKQMRFYSTESLKSLTSHSLQLDKEFINVLLVTENQDILISITDDALYRFTKEGEPIGAVPVDAELFKCFHGTVCMARGDQILAAKHNGSIHWFDLQGGHNIIGQIAGDVKYTWSIGIEDGEFVYITYSLRDRSDYIVKCRLV